MREGGEAVWALDLAGDSTAKFLRNRPRRSRVMDHLMAAQHRFAKTSVAAAVAVAVLVLNPFFGLLRDDFHYGALEMRAAIEGTWQLTLTPAEAPPRTLTFTLAQGAEPNQTHATRTLVRPAAACASRSLVKSAGACKDVTDMPLEVTLIAGGQAQRQPDHAHFSVVGMQFREGDLELALADVYLSARVTPRGEVEHVSSSVHDEPDAPSKDVAATLVRIKR